MAKFTGGMKFAFGELLDDIGSWLMVGVLLAGLIGVFLSPGMIETYLGDGIVSMLLMLVLATPLYVCATASTPIAAALVLKGLSPGAALVFLLAGPATNVATMTVVSKLLGKKTMLIYLTSILISSLLFGMLVNFIYEVSGLSIQGWISSGSGESHGMIAYAATLILLLLLLKGYMTKLRVHFKKQEGLQPL